MIHVRTRARIQNRQGTDGVKVIQIFFFFYSQRIFIARVYVTLFVRVRGFNIFLVCVHQHRVFDPPLVCKSNAY